MRALVVDGEGRYESIVSLLLEKAGCEVVHANNGLEDIQEVVRKDFDFVVLDWMIPSWSAGEGLKLSDRWISAMKPEAAPVPVLLYSAFDLRLLQFPLCRNFQVRSFLSKNSTPSEQAQALEQFVVELQNGEC